MFGGFLAGGDAVGQFTDLAFALRDQLAARGHLPADELQLVERVVALGFVVLDLLLQLGDFLAQCGAARLLLGRVLRLQPGSGQQQDGGGRQYAQRPRHLFFWSARFL